MVIINVIIYKIIDALINKKLKILIEINIKTKILVKNNSINIFIYEKKKNKVGLIPVWITSFELLMKVENQKSRKYDLLNK